MITPEVQVCSTPYRLRVLPICPGPAASLVRGNLRPPCEVLLPRPLALALALALTQAHAPVSPSHSALTALNGSFGAEAPAMLLASH